MAGKNYELLYFNMPGRGEVLRMVFHFLGKPFTDTTVEFSEWPALKNDVSKVPCGFMPVLTKPTGEKLVQTVAILRYLGNEFDLYGKNNTERARIDAVLDFNKELYDAFVQIFFYTKDADLKTKLSEELDKNATHAFKYFDVIIKGNKDGPYFVGNKPSIADIYFLALIERLDILLPEKKYVEQYPSLKTLKEKAMAYSPTLQSYLKNRK